MTRKTLGETRMVGDGQIDYVRDVGHGHEGGHRIAVAGREVIALPDGRTTAINRNHVITAVLHSFAGSGLDPTDALVGALILTGATNLEVDGRSVLGGDHDRVLAALRLEVVDGSEAITFRITSIGGGR